MGLRISYGPRRVPAERAIGRGHSRGEDQDRQRRKSPRAGPAAVGCRSRGRFLRTRKGPCNQEKQVKDEPRRLFLQLRNKVLSGIESDGWFGLLGRLQISLCSLNDEKLEQSLEQSHPTHRSHHGQGQGTSPSSGHYRRPGRLPLMVSAITRTRNKNDRKDFTTQPSHLNGPSMLAQQTSDSWPPRSTSARPMFPHRINGRFHRVFGPASVGEWTEECRAVVPPHARASLRP